MVDAVEKEACQELSKLEQANLKIKKSIYWTLGAGIIPFPIIDLVAVSGVQLKMVAQIAEIYEKPFTENVAKSYISALIGAALPNTLAAGSLGSLMKAIPGIGSLTGAVSQSLLSGAATYAIGKIFIAHFELGGNFLNFNVDNSKKAFKEQFDKGKAVVKNMMPGK